jgi:hypothetical protein
MGKKELREYAENLLNGFNYQYINYSDTNGQSMYFDVDGVKVRFSDHSVTNKDRITNELHFSINDIGSAYQNFATEQSLFNLRYRLGDERIRYGKRQMLMRSGKYLEGYGYTETNEYARDCFMAGGLIEKPNKVVWDLQSQIIAVTNELIDNANLSDYIKDELRKVRPYIVDSRRGFAYQYKGFFSVPLWAYKVSKRTKKEYEKAYKENPKWNENMKDSSGYFIYYVAHELAHFICYITNKNESDCNGHKKNFYDAFKKICPYKYQYYELGYIKSAINFEVPTYEQCLVIPAEEQTEETEHCSIGNNNVVGEKQKTENLIDTRIKGLQIALKVAKAENKPKIETRIKGLEIAQRMQKFNKGGMTNKGYVTYKDKYNTKYGYTKSESHSLEQISKDTGVSMKGLQQIYNKGIGAYKMNPSSVRPNVKSKEQWAMARVYSAVMGGKASKVDAKELKMAKGGLIAPNGKKSNLTALQYKLVRTKAFKDWFGDWENSPYLSSIILDDNFEPKVVYHGTNAESIDVFDRKQGGYYKGRKMGIDAIGVWFTDDKEYAQHLGQNVYEVFLSLKNPKEYIISENEAKNILKISNDNFISDEEVNAQQEYNEVKDLQKDLAILKEVDLLKKYKLSESDLPMFRNKWNKKTKALEHKLEKAKKITNSIKSESKQKAIKDDPLKQFIRFSKECCKDESTNDIDTEKVRNELMSVGLTDGIVLYNTTGDSIILETERPINMYVVFEPNQIKLADGRNTTFDGNNPDIRFDCGGKVEDLISQGVVELKMFDTKSEHAKEYGLYSVNPLYVQSLCITENQRLKGIGNKVLKYIDDYAIKNGHDVVFGHITQKAEFTKDNRQTFFCDIDMIKNWLHSKGYAINNDNNDFHKIFNPDIRFNGGGNVKSDAFKKWFGNSKVVDKKGNPLIVYHGSPDLRGLKEKYIFESRFLDNQSFFFTDNYSMAKSYADPKRAFDYQNAEEGVIRLYLSLQNPLIVNAFNQIWRKFETTIDGNKIIGTRNLINFSKNKGYDGVIVENVRDYYNNNDKKTKGGNVYVAFYPNQIKLADGTNKTFDGNNPDIRYAFGGGVKNLSAEDMLKKPLTKKKLKDLDDGEGWWVENYHAKTKNYKPNTYYHLNTKAKGLNAGVGKGLYLGKDKDALISFYGIDLDDIIIDTYVGNINWLDLIDYKDYKEFEIEAIKKYGKNYTQKSSLSDVDLRGQFIKKLTIEKGFDGVRYYDPYATGEEFVLFNTKKLKKVENSESKFNKKREY